MMKSSHPPDNPYAAGDVEAPIVFFPLAAHTGAFYAALESLPTADQPVPALGSESWVAWSHAVFEEARQSTDDISSRRWMVAHPKDPRMHALIAQIESGGLASREVEMPRMVRWHSKLDGRRYTLVEFLNLVR